MKFLKHMSENLFITFTGIAALVHSTWSLGTMFSGVAPSGDWWAYAAWVLPAFLVAFAMDVGQISTSAAIRHYGLTWQRAVTFCIFAIATYYLQFLYIAHHLPMLELAQGLSDVHRDNVKTAVDAAIWILPLFLPLSTILYTLSGGDNKAQPIAPTSPEPTILISKQEQPELPAPEKKVEQLPINLTALAECKDCGWTKDCETHEKAARALRTHHSLHCTAKSRDLEKVSQNGHFD